MKKLLIFSLLITLPIFTAMAQDITADSQSDTKKISKNIIKFNITSTLVKNYSLQYERVLSRNVSVAASFRIMPESGIPYADNIIKWFDITEPDAKKILNSTNLANYAITPEIRFYTGKKRYGNGLYFSLFYRYGNYTFNNALIPFETDLGNEVTLSTSGEITTHTGGFMLGAQWAFGKHICLDWWIIGPHLGVSSGDITGLSSGPLSAIDQENIEDDLNGIGIKMLEQTVNATSNKVTMVFDGPWVGIRAGLSLGVRF